MKHRNTAYKYGANYAEKRAFNEVEAGIYIGKSVFWMRDARIGRSAVEGPTWTKVGRAVVYMLEDLDGWLDSFKASA